MDTENTIESWAAKEIAADKPAVAPKGISEEQISEKTRLGLSRAEAITIIKNQADHDARLAEEDKAEKAKAAGKAKAK